MEIKPVHKKPRRGREPKLPARNIIETRQGRIIDFTMVTKQTMPQARPPRSKNRKVKQNLFIIKKDGEVHG